MVNRDSLTVKDNTTPPTATNTQKTTERSSSLYSHLEAGKRLVLRNDETGIGKILSFGIAAHYLDHNPMARVPLLHPIAAFPVPKLNGRGRLPSIPIIPKACLPSTLGKLFAWLLTISAFLVLPQVNGTAVHRFPLQPQPIFLLLQSANVLLPFAQIQRATLEVGPLLSHRTLGLQGITVFL